MQIHYQPLFLLTKLDKKLKYIGFQSSVIFEIMMQISGFSGSKKRSM